MSTRKSGMALLAKGIAVALLCGTGLQMARSQEKPADAGAQEKRLAAFKGKGAKVSISVLPALMRGNASKEVGDALALVLEQQGGLEDVSFVETEFKPAAGTGFASMPPLLGEFVKKNPVKSDYALLAEFMIEQKTFSEVAAWIVDRDGALVWADSQHRGDADFDRVKPGEPLECCSLVSERVRGLLGLPVPAGEHDGRMSRRWKEKSGLPSDKEIEAMKARLAVFVKAGAAAKVTVFPVRVAGDLDVAEGGALAKLLGSACAATATQVKPVVDFKPSSNEQRTLWDLARAFQAHLAKNPVDSDYALMAEYLTNPERGQVGGVHFVVCTRTGEWVIVDFQNSHHDDFQSIDPKNPADCNQLVLKRLEGYLKH